MNCICGKEMEKRVIRDFVYAECKFCGYLAKLDLVSAEREKERYDAHICDEDYLEYMKRVYALVEKHIRGRSLDFGCGKIHALADLIPSEYYDLYYYPEFPKGTFDTILLIEVFEHIADTMELMNSLKNKLNSKGKIIIMTQIKKYPLENWWYLRDITHIRFVDVKTMEQIASLLDMNLILENGYFVFEKK